MAALPAHDSWRRDNERGLALAADGDWSEASEAFAAAADSLARSLPSDTRGVHEPLALVLSNLSQAYFRVGRVDDAMQQAQRACALRVAIAGEDGMPVARSRMDLAVMLATAGRLEEATALVQRAIAGIEHRVGEEDARLSIVLENAARIALAAGNPANAEPLLIRLHALLDAHELSTSRAELLLGRVAHARARQAAVESSPTLSTVAAADEPAHSLAAFDDDDALSRVYAHATIAEQEEWEDQPLRDAVAVTDILLRTTPSGVPIIPPSPTLEPPIVVEDVSTADEVELMLDTMDLTDVLPAPSLLDPDADFLLSIEPDTVDSPLTSLSLELTDVDVVVPEVETPMSTSSRPEVVTPTVNDTEFDLELAFDDPPAVFLSASMPSAPTASSATPEPPPSMLPPAPAGMMLDFAVEHGMADDVEPVLQRPPISSPIPDALDVAPIDPPAPARMPHTQIVSAGSSAGIAPIADIVQTAPPPASPADAARSVSGAVSSRSTQPSDQRPVRRTTEERIVMPAAATPAKGKGGLIAIVAGVVVVAGAAAAFFLLR
ncbi:hypothetical protein MASR1M101_41080 [Gemmatimonas sp.]